MAAPYIGTRSTGVLTTSSPRGRSNSEGEIVSPDASASIITSTPHLAGVTPPVPVMASFLLMRVLLFKYQDSVGSAETEGIGERALHPCLARLADQIKRAYRICLAISAGAPLALALERQVFEESALKIHNFYDASECGGIAFDFTDAPRESAEILGSPLPGVNVTTGRDGRLQVTSDAVAACYDAPRADDLLENGVDLTRDLGFIDSNRIIHLTGTTGSAINVAGRKISPTKVEAAIIATGLVRRVKVMGMASSDPERFEEIAAHVEVHAGVTPAAGLLVRASEGAHRFTIHRGFTTAPTRPLQHSSTQ